MKLKDWIIENVRSRNSRVHQRRANASQDNRLRSISADDEAADHHLVADLDAQPG